MLNRSAKTGKKLSGQVRGHRNGLAFEEAGPCLSGVRALSGARAGEEGQIQGFCGRQRSRQGVRQGAKGEGSQAGDQGACRKKNFQGERQTKQRRQKKVQERQMNASRIDKSSAGLMRGKLICAPVIAVRIFCCAGQPARASSATESKPHLPVCATCFIDNYEQLVRVHSRLCTQ